MNKLNLDKIIKEENIKALIFDCDGTLVDSMPLHMKAWEEAFKIYKTEYKYDFLLSKKGMKETEIIDSYNKEFGTQINSEEIVNIKHNYFIEHLDIVKPIIDVVGIAKEFHSKLPMAVVSGSAGNIVRGELKVIGVLALFEPVLTADDPYKAKPEPDLFLAAASQLNTNPEYCLVFEDGDPGLEGALKAGMNTIDIRDYSFIKKA